MVDGSDGASVEIEAIPYPMVGYGVEDGVPTVRQVNDAATAAFDTVSPGEPVTKLLARATTAEESVLEEVSSAITDGRDLTIPVDASSGTRYRLERIDAPADAGCDGYILAGPDGGRCSEELDPDRIASVISHDLRNPLDVATAHLRAARETGDEEHFNEIARSHDRIERIIQDVLTLARGEQAVNVTGAVEVGEVAADAWSTVDTDGASLKIHEDLPGIRADPDRLRRVFENLYRNSVEHAGRNGEPIDITVGPVDTGFFVADDGAGIPPDEQDRVFEPGYSAGGDASGTGLGLAIVERIATAHDWQLTLTESTTGGARFEFHVSEVTDAQ